MGMRLPFARSDFIRGVADVPRVALRNRFVEPNPVLNNGEGSAIARPGMVKFAEVGVGPIRGLFSAPGLFNEDLFVASGQSLYRVSSVDGSDTLIGQISQQTVGDVSWAAVANIGETPGRLFLASGGILWVYTQNGEAQGQLEATGIIVATDVVRIGGVYYQFVAGSVDAGTPAGTVGSPWLVALGTGNGTAIANLYAAINGTGDVGVQYSTALEPHPEVRATAFTASDLFVNANVAGAGGNVIVTTETGAGLAWGAGTLTGGGQPQLRQVTLPNNEGAISVASINSYVIVVPEQSDDFESVGKFYWIVPGETVIDGLDFANAERSPDKILQVRVFGNLFWLLGQETTEPWVTTADPDAPMQRYQSILYDRGSWEGTAVQVKDSLIVVDQDGAVFMISGGQNRISSPSIEERVRKAILTQKQGL